jgi:hypothetical protein
MKYEFASLRGDNFIAEGNTPEDAYKNLVEQEKDEGTLWRLSDPYLVEHCIRRGWSRLGQNPGVAYRVVNPNQSEIIAALKGQLESLLEIGSVVQTDDEILENNKRRQKARELLNELE